MTTTVHWKVVGLDVRPGFVLRVRFADGVAGDVDMKPLLSRPDVAQTVFAPLRDTAYFARATIDRGAVTWPNGADLAPDAMYDAIASRGAWRPG
jgi:Protein of unknown function (DUF2442)